MTESKNQKWNKNERFSYKSVYSLDKSFLICACVCVYVCEYV